MASGFPIPSPNPSTDSSGDGTGASVPIGVPMENGGYVYMRPGYQRSGYQNGSTNFSGYLNFMPIYAAARLSVIAAAVEVATAGAGSARVGLYSDNLAAGQTQADMIGELIHDFGALSGAAVGVVKTPDLTTPIILEPGYYWLATVISTGVTILTMHETTDPVRPAYNNLSASGSSENVPCLNTGEAVVTDGLPTTLMPTDSINIGHASGGFLLARLAA